MKLVLQSFWISGMAFLAVVLFALFFASGCRIEYYPYLDWALENNVPFEAKVLTLEEMLDAGYSDDTRGVYRGKVGGRHLILLRRWYKDDLRTLNHELGHAKGEIAREE